MSRGHVYAHGRRASKLSASSEEEPRKCIKLRALHAKGAFADCSTKALSRTEKNNYPLSSSFINYYNMEKDSEEKKKKKKKERE